MKFSRYHLITQLSIGFIFKTKISNPTKSLLTIYRALIVVLLTFTPASQCAEVIVVVNEWRPYVYTDNHTGKIGGEAFELMSSILKDTKVSYRQVVLEWSDAYLKAVHTDNACIYPIARIPARERVFVWLAPVGKKIKSYIWSLKPDLLFNEDSVIGVPRDSMDHIYLSINSPLANSIQVFESDDMMIKALHEGEIDFISDVEKNLFAISNSLGYKATKLNRIMELNEYQTYIACNSRISKRLFLKMKKSFEKK